MSGDERRTSGDEGRRRLDAEELVVRVVAHDASEREVAVEVAQLAPQLRLPHGRSGEMTGGRGR